MGGPRARRGVPRGDLRRRLAHHYTEAGLTEQAVNYWRRAGQRAIEQLGERRGGRQLAPVSMRSLEYRRRS